jgi:uncharacterized membrane protein YqjE
MSAASQGSEKSLGQLFGDLVGETRTLLRQEIALAKTELSEKAAYAGRNAGMAAAGALIILLGALPIVAGIVISLGHKIGYATSAFLVGALFVVIGAVLVMKALKALKAESLKPEQTAAQVKETKQWMKEQTR